MPSSEPLRPRWVFDLRNGVRPEYLQVADDVWANRSSFLEWPVVPELFMPGTVRGLVKFHNYDGGQRDRLKAAKIRADRRSNGPAVMAYLLAGGRRPLRTARRDGWSIHHIYDGQFPAPGRTATVRAVGHGDYFTNAAGLAAVHPIADALADELAYFAWLLRHEAFLRFGFDPDGVFGELPSGGGTTTDRVGAGLSAVRRSPTPG